MQVVLLSSILRSVILTFVTELCFLFLAYKNNYYFEDKYVLC